MNKSLLLLGFALVLCACKSPEMEPQSVFKNVRRGMTREEFLASVPESVDVIEQGQEFVTVGYLDDASGEIKVSHVWFVDGAVLSVPMKVKTE